MLKLHNTLTKKLEPFEPITPNKVGMYHCGPTVYGIQHIGNLSMYVFTDILRRTLESDGFEVKQVINFTDFGHLTGENQGTPDEGEDKMSKGLRNEGLEPTLENMKVLGKKYATIFLEDIAKLNVKTDGTIFPYASDYIPQQIALIKTLEEKGFAYQTSDGLYFDISKFPNYGKLGNVNQDIGESRIGLNSEKRNPQDFALWKFNDKIGWASPWGQGFPGWHIECSAMIIDILGEQIDIHTGGIEHIPIHHNNEIAQSEAATGLSPFSKYWLHRAHLQINDSKIAKSDGNVVYLSEIIKKGYSPLALRYLLLGAHYKTPTNFTWEALEGAQTAYTKLLKAYRNLGVQHLSDLEAKLPSRYQKQFQAFMEDDLNTPRALAVIWELLKDDAVSDADKKTILDGFDTILGLDLNKQSLQISVSETIQVTDLPPEIQILIEKREQARKNKDFATSDKLRDELKEKGYLVEDKPEGPQISLVK